jgi:5'-nucleotidase/UDP-sugar diphosphatase
MIRTTRLAVAAAAGAAFILPVAFTAAPAQAAPGDPLTLNVFHINDSHSKLQPGSGSVDLGTSGGEFDYELGGWPRVDAQFKALEAANAGENNINIHAGDAITGTLFYTLFEGEAEAALMNETCFDIFEVGNHEFDSGDEGLVKFLDFLNDPDGDGDDTNDPCNTDVLGANVIPAAGTPLNPDPDPAVTSDDYLQPYVIREFVDVNSDMQEVGFIGIDIAEKTKNSSSPLDTTEFLDEVETTQQYVDELTGMGVENIVLVTHYQYDNDLALAAAVTDVDAIIGGDSHTLLGDFSAFGIESDGPYPTIVQNADGADVCVVQAWQYSAVVGDIELNFENGELTSCDGDPQLLVGEFSRDDAPITEPELTEIGNAIDAIPTVTWIEGNPDAQAILDTFAAEVDELAAQIIGTTADPICLNRLPGDTRSAGICTPDQVAASGARADVNGGFMQQIVTDAFLARSFEADIALQNAGGVRIALPPGDISIADAYEILPFANTLVNLELSGAEVVQSLEDAAANFVDNPGGSNGSYPYGSAIRWDADLSQPAGERFTNVEVRGDDGEWGPIDLAAMYTVVTNSFIASGQDGYTTFGVAYDEGRFVDTGIDYAQGFIDWLTDDAAGVVTIPPASEFSTQTFVGANGELFAPAGPIRMLDTRARNQTVGTTFDGQFENTGFMNPGTTLELQIGGRGVVPPTATAVALNVTATETAGAGYITAWPCGVAQPAASTVNYLFSGVTVANSIIVPVGDDGKVCLETTVAGAHIVVDLTGWSANSDGLDPLTPARLIDTRAVDADGNGRTIDGVSSAVGIMRPGTPVTLQVAGRGGVPADAVAVAINLAVIGNTAPGFITAWPCGVSKPLASSLNYTGNTSVANSVIVPLSATGTLCLEADVSSTHLVGDVTAAFAESDEFGGLVPTRFLDTRAPTVDLGQTFDDIGENTGLLQPGVAYELQITGRGPTPEGADEGEGIVPSNASLISINLAVTDTRGPGFLTVWPCDEERPIASSINYSTVGVSVANSILVPLSSEGTVCIASDVSGTHAVADVTGYIL